jgi:hypothetical protein
MSPLLIDMSWFGVSTGFYHPSVTFAASPTAFPTHATSTTNTSATTTDTFSPAPAAT